MIRTLIADHHPALRTGVKVVLEAERDTVVVGDTGALDELLPLLRRTRPDVVLLDCHPSEGRRPCACRFIKCLIPAPGCSSTPRTPRVFARRGTRRRRRRPARQELLGARPGPGDPCHPRRPPATQPHSTPRASGDESTTSWAACAPSRLGPWRTSRATAPPRSDAPRRASHRGPLPRPTARPRPSRASVISRRFRSAISGTTT
jgi:CheY-like chemotaxis protein